MSKQAAPTMIPIRSDQLRQTAEFVKFAQPVIRKAGVTEAAIEKLAPQVVDSLVKSGCLHENLKEAKIREFTQNPEKILEELEKVASRVQTRPLGIPADGVVSGSEKQGSADQVFIGVLTGAS